MKMCLDKDGMRIIHIASFCLFVALGVSYNAAQNCSGLDASIAELASGMWYPENCTDAKVPLGTRCFVKCKENYVFPPGAKIEKQCVKAALSYYSYVPDGSVTHCTGTPCPALQVADNNIKIFPEECQTRGVDAKKACYFHCQSGYKLVGLSQKSCLVNGSYSPLGGAYCVPELPKTLDVACPQDSFTIYTDSGKSTSDAQGLLGYPTGIFDDSWVSLNIVSDSKDIHSLPVGKHHFQYVIEGNAEQEKSFCNMFVEVKDEEPPYAEDCPEEFDYVIPSGESIVSEKRPYQFKDAVDQSSTFLQKLSRDIMGADLEVGKYEQVLKVQDNGGNVAFCTITIQVKDGGKCRARNPPLNAVTYLNKDVAAWRYKANCTGGTTQLCDLTLITAGLEVGRCFFGVPCSSDFFFSAPLPSCDVIQEKVNKACPAETVEMSTGKCTPCPRTFYYDAQTKKCVRCPQNQTNDKIGSTSCQPCPANQMTSNIGGGPRFCENICPDGYAVDTATKICTKCPANTYVISGGTSCQACPSALFTFQDGARSLEDCAFGQIATDSSGTVKLDEQEAPKYSNWTLRLNPSFVPTRPIYQRMSLMIKSEQLAKETDCSQSFVLVKGMQRGFTTVLSDKLCGSALNEPFSVKFRPWRINLLEYHWRGGQKPDLTVSFGIANCSRGEYYNMTMFRCLACARNTFQNETGRSLCMPCPPGRAAPREGLAFCQEGCRPGYYRNELRCEPCPMGSYSESRESSFCQKCSANKSTAHIATDNRTKCIDSCGSGFFRLSNGTCALCPVGTYQDRPSHASPRCKFCSKGNTTRRKGSQSIQDCYISCSLEGEFFNETSKECEKCPLGTYKFISSIIPSSCTACPMNYTTERVGAMSKLECVKLEGYNNCKPNPCTFPGRCVDKGETFECICPAQYSGRFCETALHPCTRKPCQNNGTCYDQSSNTYFCDCTPGFVGKLCESKYQACDSAPCQNNGTCTNVGNSYKCTCLPYFTGQVCHITMTKPCDNKPCIHGECQNGAFPGADPPYTCKCRFDYTGKNCETSFDDCASNPCFANGTAECEDRVLDFFCRCKTGYGGKTCNTSLVCNAGQYYEYSCKPCPRGTYQPKRMFTESCSKCPSGTTTVQLGIKIAKRCADFDKAIVLKVSLRITSLAWQADLLDTQTSAFISYADQVRNEILALYDPNSKFIDVKILAFRQGSVVTDMDIYFEDGASSPDNALKKAVESGTIGNMTVDSNSLKLETKKPGKKSTDRTILIVVVVLASILVLAVIIGVLYWQKMCRRPRVSFNKIFDRKEGSDSPSVRLQKVR